MISNQFVFIFISGLLIYLGVSKVQGNCEISGIELPDHLHPDPAGNDTTGSGEMARILCKESNLFIDPDEESKNALEVKCGTDGKFEIPDPWPFCIVKCDPSKLSEDLGFSIPEGTELQIVSIL